MQHSALLCAAIPAERLSKLGRPLERCASSHGVAQDLVSLQTAAETCRVLQA